MSNTKVADVHFLIQTPTNLVQQPWIASVNKVLINGIFLQFMKCLHKLHIFHFPIFACAFALAVKIHLHLNAAKKREFYTSTYAQ